MNKNQFLNSLRRHLSPLNTDERNEIIEFYEDRFNNAVYEGKSETDVINELETPEEIARNVLSEYGIEKQTQKRGVSPAEIIGILFFDLFISSWLIPVLIIVPASLTFSWFSYFLTIEVFFEYNFLKALMAFIIATGVFLLYLIAIILIIEIAIKILSSILYWHIAVFSGNRFNDYQPKIRNISLLNLLNKYNINNKLLFKVAAISIAISLSLSIVWRGVSALEDDNSNSHTTVNEYVVNDDYKLYTDLVNVSIEIKPTTSDKMVVTHYNKQQADITYKVRDNELQIIDNTQSNIFNTSKPLSRLFTYLDGNSILNTKSQIVIEIPNDISFSSISINTENGGIDVTNIDSSVIYLDTINGTINIEDFTSSEINTSTVNGRIDISNGTAVITKALLTNGSIEISNLNTPSNDGESVTAATVNGSINFEDVYSKDVSGSTVNGSIDFFNSDKNYKVEDYNFNTVIGKVEHNLSR